MPASGYWPESRKRESEQLRRGLPRPWGHRGPAWRGAITGTCGALPRCEGSPWRANGKSVCTTSAATTPHALSALANSKHVAGPSVRLEAGKGGWQRVGANDFTPRRNLHTLVPSRRPWGQRWKLPEASLTTAPRPLTKRSARTHPRALEAKRGCVAGHGSSPRADRAPLSATPCRLGYQAPTLSPLGVSPTAQ